MNRDGVLNLEGQREDGADRHLGDEAEPFDEIGPMGLGHRGRQHPIDDVKTDGLGFLGDLGGDFFHRLFGDRRNKRIDVGDVEGIGPVTAGFVFPGELAGDNRFEQFYAIGMLTNERFEFSLEVEIWQGAQPGDERFTVRVWHGVESWI